MRLNHINLSVPDVQHARNFFEKYFGLRCVAEKGRDVLNVLMDESGFILTLSNFDKSTEIRYPKVFHIGFMRDSRDQVDTIYERLKADGFDMEPPREFHGAWTFYLRDPAGFLIEVGHQHEM
jgi:catechol 2,3-dioxygenase-like lactoylglutathione lyase family enzyme